MVAPLWPREAEGIRETAVGISHLQTHGLTVVDELARLLGYKHCGWVRLVVGSLFLSASVDQQITPKAKPQAGDEEFLAADRRAGDFRKHLAAGSDREPPTHTL